MKKLKENLPSAFNQHILSNGLRIIQQLAADGAQAVILGCTEICLLLGPNDACLPLYDTAALHVDAGLNWALQP
jgi:aspartate/glutamate racemase